MKETYYLTGNNVCVINFAYTVDGVTCYTDLMKVGVALDTGEVASFDATGYIMNHKKRSFQGIKVSQAYARARLSRNLTVKTATLALIPRNGTGEVLCYEFKCTAAKGTKNIINYFNVTSGVEEQILILTKTPGGTLAM
jgi:spore germination protein